MADINVNTIDLIKTRTLKILKVKSIALDVTGEFTHHIIVMCNILNFADNYIY